MNIKERVIRILQKLSGLDDICEQDTLQGNIALDSLSMVTLLINVEDEFGITLNESDMNPFDLRTVADIIALVKKY